MDNYFSKIGRRSKFARRRLRIPVKGVDRRGSIDHLFLPLVGHHSTTSLLLASTYWPLIDRVHTATTPSDMSLQLEYRVYDVRQLTPVLLTSLSFVSLCCKYTDNLSTKKDKYPKWLDSYCFHEVMHWVRWYGHQVISLPL